MTTTSLRGHYKRQIRTVPIQTKILRCYEHQCVRLSPACSHRTLLNPASEWSLTWGLVAIPYTKEEIHKPSVVYIAVFSVCGFSSVTDRTLVNTSVRLALNNVIKPFTRGTFLTEASIQSLLRR